MRFKLFVVRRESSRLFIFPASPNLTLSSSQTLMLVSSTTRPLLGCVWNFATSYSGLAYATTSMVIHETLPIILMAFTNLGSLYTLYSHGRIRSSSQDAPIIKRVPAERRAAKVGRRTWCYEAFGGLNVEFEFAQPDQNFEG